MRDGVRVREELRGEERGKGQGDDDGQGQGDGWGEGKALPWVRVRVRVGARVRPYLGVEDLDGEGAPGDGEDGALEEVGRVLLCVEGGGGADDLEVLAPLEQPLE